MNSSAWIKKEDVKIFVDDIHHHWGWNDNIPNIDWDRTNPNILYQIFSWSNTLVDPDQPHWGPLFYLDVNYHRCIFSWTGIWTPGRYIKIESRVNKSEFLLEVDTLTDRSSKFFASWGVIKKNIPAVCAE